MYGKEKDTSLTEIQRNILHFIDQCSHQQGLPPTLREIAKEFGYSAVGTVQDHLRALKQKGFLQQESHVACGLKLTSRPPLQSIPILGAVPAGKPNEAIESALGFLPVPNSKVRGQLFALLVKGESMIDAGIMDGDYVIVQKQAAAEDGEIVVALIDGEATVKKLEKRGTKVRLMPANSRFRPIELQPTQENLIQGKVVSVQRYY